MFFGLALLAGFLGYAFVDPFGSEEDTADADAASLQSDVADEVGTDLIEGPVDAAADQSEEAEGEADPREETEGEDPEANDPESPTDPLDVAADQTGDVIDGTGADDLIYGGDGDYVMNGGDGDDQLHGGDGDTTINGDDGNDVLFAGDGYVGISTNTLNGGGGDDTIYGSNEAENTLNGGDGNDEIHMRGHDSATGGSGSDSFHYSTEYSNGMQSAITDYDASEDQIIVEHAAGFVSGGEMPEPEVTIKIDGTDAVICLDGNECVIVQGAAASLRVDDILLRASPTF